MTNKESNDNMSDAPHYRINNIIFENKNNSKIRVKIIVKIIIYLILASLLGAFLSNINIKYKYGNLIEQVEDIEKSGDMIILDYTKIIKEVSPSLVTINNSKDKLLDEVYSDKNVTGVIINSDGIILTNYSAIKDSNDIFVKLPSIEEEPIKAELLVADEDIDFAIIKITFDGELKPIKIAKRDEIKEGQGIVILGNATGDSYVGSVIPGIITTRDEKVITRDNREYSLLQINATINSKNTGGAICNSKGELIAIANLSITKQRNENGLYYGIETEGLNEMIDSTNSFKQILGIKEGGIIVDERGDFTGFYIDELIRNGSSYRAGIKPTDIIVEIDGHQVINVKDIIVILKNKKKDDTLECSILSDGELRKVEIKIAE